MEHGALARSAFMREIVTMTKHIVAQAKNYESDTIPGDFATLAARCPKCGGEVHEKYKKFQCVDCDFGFWKIMGGRQLAPSEAETLLETREVGPLDGFRSRLGRPFSAKLRLTDANEVEFDFGPRADDEEGPPPDFSTQTPLGPCPKCGHRVFETPNAYVCERAVGEGRTCDFRSGRTILQRVIERTQMTKLLETGKTDLLQFVSARTRRPFSAYLVKQPDGKVGFEFEAKEPGRRGARPMRSAPLRVLGTHPRDGEPVELHAGRYGPYVKHGTTNATLPDKAAAETLSLEDAIALVDEKAGRSRADTARHPVKPRAPRKPRVTARQPDAGAPPPRRVAPPRGARRVESSTSEAAPRTTVAKRAPATTRLSDAKPAIARTATPPAAKRTTKRGAAAVAGAKTPGNGATVRKATAKTKAPASMRSKRSPIAPKSAPRTAAKKTKRR
jgi:endogenous inhibitor of DNA gyrase (YacG/DUF329 family)